MTRAKTLAEGATELEQVWNTRRDYYELFMEDYQRALRNLDPTLAEICRLRVAAMVESDFDQSVRYAPAIEAGLTDEKIAQIPNYPTSELFSERERACLEFTEQWVIQSSSIDDDDCATIQTFITPEEFIYFCKVLSVVDQFARANSIFDIQPGDRVPAAMTDFSLAPALATN